MANPDDLRYKHAVEATAWPVRKKALLNLFFSIIPSADVIACQEMDYFPFHEDLLPVLRDHGFDGMHQWDGTLKEGRPPHPWGCATLYRADKFQVGFKETRSRGLVLGLYRLPRSSAETTPPIDYFVINVHLEANSNKVEQQLKQLHGTIYKMSTHAEVNPATARVLVCGDFNSRLEDQPMTWLLQGSLPGPDPPVNAHAFRFESALDAAGFAPVTYADPFCAERVDHLVSFLFPPSMPPSKKSGSMASKADSPFVAHVGFHGRYTGCERRIPDPHARSWTLVFFRVS